MEIGECILLARGNASRQIPAAAELELLFKGTGKKAALHLVWVSQTGGGADTPGGGIPNSGRHSSAAYDAPVVAVVDRALTNRAPHLRQNSRGLRDAAGRLLSTAAAGLVKLRVVSVRPAPTHGSGVLEIAAAVVLLPSAFDAVIPKHTPTRAAMGLMSEQLAAAAAAAALASSLVEIVEMLEDGGPPESEDDDGGPLGSQDPAEAAAAADAAAFNGVDGGPAGANGPSTSAAAAAAAGRGRPSTSAAAAADVDMTGGDAAGHHHDEEEEEEEPQQDATEGAAAAARNDVRDEVFDIVAPRDWSVTHPDPPGLKCRLYRYQQRALAWMVWRETQPELGPEGCEDGEGRGGDPAAAAASSSADGRVPAPSSSAAAAAAAAATAHLGDFATQDLFWRRATLRDGQELWISPFPGGGVRKDPPPPPPRQRVGILAEEMGLGKTVEVIALMLARPPPPPALRSSSKGSLSSYDGTAAAGGSGSGSGDGGGEGNGNGGTNAAGGGEGSGRGGSRGGAGRGVDGGGGESGGGGGGASGRLPGPSLIVVPAPLLQQWSEELARHSNLKVVVYDGLKWQNQQTQEKEKAKAKEAKRLAVEREKQAKIAAREAKAREREAKRQQQARARAEREAARQRNAAAAAAGASGSGGTRKNGRRKSKLGGAEREAKKGRRSSSSRARHEDDDGDDDDDDGIIDLLESEERDGGDSSEEDDDSEDESYEVGKSYNKRTRRNSSNNSNSKRQRRGSEPPPRRASEADNGAAAAAAPAASALAPADGAGPSTSAAAAAAAGPSMSAAAAAVPPTAAAATTTLLPASAANPSTANPPPPLSRLELYQRELVAALYAGTPLCPPSCDPQAEAAEALAGLLGAEVVLTTYAVLREEVHYSPGSQRGVLSGLRYEKKYAVPESPLMQVRWYRLVLDEAQMAGHSMSHVAVMAARMEAEHRWCVTGTPIGPGGLEDILGLVRILRYTPYDDPLVFRRLISEPYKSGSSEGRSRLAALLKPIMWRNSKAVQALDHPLPPRTLQEAHLRFSAAEEAFYEVILGETRRAFDEMTSHQRQQQQQQQQDQEQQQQQQQGSQQQQRRPADGPLDLTGDDDAGHQGRDGGHAHAAHANSTPAAAAAAGAEKKKHPRANNRRRRDRGAELVQEAHGELHQLRLACVHPKLTRYWRQMASEL
ncbi:hypothetical protein Agub_g15018, partial [Astrephomene gubernaculifera]